MKSTLFLNNPWKGILFLLLLMLSGQGYAQTEMKFVNPNQVPLYFNPAFTGSLDQGRLALTYRKQWISIPGAPAIVYGSWDQYLTPLHGGIGVSAFYESIGPFRFFSAGGSYSPKFQVGNSVTLAPAVGVRITRAGLDADYLNPVTPDPSIPERDTAIWYPDFQAGFLFNTPSFYLGASVLHVFKPKIDYTPNSIYTSRLARTFTAQAGYTFKAHPDADWSLSVNANYMKQFTNLGQVMFSGKYKFIVAGAGFDSSKSLLLMAGIKTKRIKFTYGYGYPREGLRISGNSSHEASILYYFRNSKDR